MGGKTGLFCPMSIVAVRCFICYLVHTSKLRILARFNLASGADVPLFQCDTCRLNSLKEANDKRCRCCHIVRKKQRFHPVAPWIHYVKEDLRAFTTFAPVATTVRGTTKTTASYFCTAAVFP